MEVESLGGSGGTSSLHGQSSPFWRGLRAGRLKELWQATSTEKKGTQAPSRRTLLAGF